MSICQGLCIIITEAKKRDKLSGFACKGLCLQGLVQAVGLIRFAKSRGASSKDCPSRSCLVCRQTIPCISRTLSSNVFKLDLWGRSGIYDDISALLFPLKKQPVTDIPSLTKGVGSILEPLGIDTASAGQAAVPL